MFVDEAKAMGLDLRFYPPFRAAEDQARMPGKTKAPGGLSSHLAGLGGDVATINGKPRQKWTADDIAALGKAVDAAKLRWGKNFKSPQPEPWHVDKWGGYSDQQRRNAIAEAQRQYAAGKLPACVVPPVS